MGITSLRDPQPSVFCVDPAEASMTQARDDDRTALLDPAIARRVEALEMLMTLLRYVDTAFVQKPRLQALLWQSIGEEKRQMYMSVCDEMRAEGRRLGKIEFLVELLNKRGLLLDDELRARVDRCTDEAQLQRWFDRALTATTVAAVFDEP
jgi:hypothetical protein